jgi:hypothetical protein
VAQPRTSAQSPCKMAIPRTTAKPPLIIIASHSSLNPGCMSVFTFEYAAY